MSDIGIDQAALTAWCVAYVADMLELAPSEINPNVKFSRIGFDLAMSVHLAVALEEHLGIALSPDVLAEHPTIPQAWSVTFPRLAVKVGAVGPSRWCRARFVDPHSPSARDGYSPRTRLPLCFSPIETWLIRR